MKLRVFYLPGGIQKLLYKECQLILIKLKYGINNNKLLFCHCRFCIQFYLLPYIKLYLLQHDL